MKKYLVILFLIVLNTYLKGNHLHTIGNPTAGVLSRGEARVHSTLIAQNGMIVGVDVGVFRNFQLGLSYGALNIVGDQAPIGMSLSDLGVRMRFRILNETLTRPAIAIGLDTQGQGAFDGQNFQYKSKGIYTVVSKTFNFLGLIGLDFGLNSSLDTSPDEHNFDFFIGLFKTLGDSFILFADYSAGIDTNNKQFNSIGFLNAGLQFNVSDQLSLKVKFHDLLLSRYQSVNPHRSLMIDYRWFF
jgi:hypothetical protein